MKKLVYAAVSLLMITGCAKDGETGPAGPAGADGAANVSVSTTFVTSSNWFTNGTTGNSDCYLWCWITPNNLSDPSAVDSGIVMNYLIDDIYSWPLPHNISYNSNLSGTLSAGYAIGQVELRYQLSNYSMPNPNLLGVFEIKTVVLSPTLKRQHPEINWNDYNQVANAFHLE